MCHLFLFWWRYPQRFCDVSNVRVSKLNIAKDVQAVVAHFVHVLLLVLKLKGGSSLFGTGRGFQVRIAR